MDRIYILLREEDEAFKFDSEDHPNIPVGINKGDELIKFRFIVDLTPDKISFDDAKERYHYFVDEGIGIVLKVIPKDGQDYYSSIPWDPKEDNHERIREIVEIFDIIEDFIVNKLAEE